MQALTSAALQGSSTTAKYEGKRRGAWVWENLWTRHEFLFLPGFISKMLELSLCSELNKRYELMDSNRELVAQLRYMLNPFFLHLLSKKCQRDEIHSLSWMGKTPSSHLIWYFLKFSKSSVLHLSSDMYKVFLFKVTILGDLTLFPVMEEKCASLDLKGTCFHLWEKFS